MTYSGSKLFSNLTNTYLSFSGNHNSAAYSSGYRSDITLLSFLRSGLYSYNSSALYGRGTYGYYWSLRGASGTNADRLGFDSTYVYPQTGNHRGYGMALRCLAR